MGVRPYECGFCRGRAPSLPFGIHINKFGGSFRTRNFSQQTAYDFLEMFVRNRFESETSSEIEQVLFQNEQFKITSHAIEENKITSGGTRYTNTYQLSDLKEASLFDPPKVSRWEIFVGLFTGIRGCLILWSAVKEISQNGWLASLLLMGLGLLFVFGALFLFSRVLQRVLYHVYLEMNRPSFSADHERLEIFSSHNRQEAKDLVADIKAAYKALKNSPSVMLTS
jgi:hypothetical protein